MGIFTKESPPPEARPKTEREERLGVLRAERDTRLRRLDEMAAAGECTVKHADQRRVELKEEFRQAENCDACGGPCRQPLACVGTRTGILTQTRSGPG